MIALGFNPATVEPATGTVVWPEGHYKVIIEKAAQQATKDGSGGMLVLTFKAVEGPMTGNTCIQYYNLWNKSALAVTIAQKEISAIAHCIGRPGAQHAEDLLNAPLIVRIQHEPGDKGVMMRIKRYTDVNGNDAKPAEAQTLSASPVADSAQQQPAWRPDAAPANAPWGQPAS